HLLAARRAVAVLFMLASASARRDVADGGRTAGDERAGRGGGGHVVRMAPDAADIAAEVEARPVVIGCRRRHRRLIDRCTWWQVRGKAGAHEGHERQCGRDKSHGLGGRGGVFLHADPRLMDESPLRMGQMTQDSGKARQRPKKTEPVTKMPAIVYAMDSCGARVKTSRFALAVPTHLC